MMDGVSIRIELQGATSDDLRSAIERDTHEILRAIEAVGAQNNRYAVDVRVVGADAGSLPSLVEVCDVLLRCVYARDSRLAHLQLADINVERRRTNSRLELELHLRQLTAAPSDPVGMLLVDIVKPTVDELQDSDLIETDIRRALESHPLIRADSEYAIAIDTPMGRGSGGSRAMLQGASLAHRAMVALRVRSSPVPNVVELRVRVAGTPDENVVRLRIWRLGFMKVPSHTRVV